MIVRARPTIWNLFFIVRGSTLPLILPRLGLIFLLSLAIVWAHATFPGFVGSIDPSPFAVLGFTLSIFLGSRNAACYDRWWEGRKIWGVLLAGGRDLGRATLILGADSPARRDILGLLIAFIQAMVAHLRNGVSHDRAIGLLPPELRDAYVASRNAPEMILRRIEEILVAERRAGRLTDNEWVALEGRVRTLGEAQTASERIRFTPVPFAYTLLLHRTTYLFCMLLPFGFVGSLGYFTPVVSTLVAYAVFGLDALGDELERPFGGQVNDLPIQALADTLEINLREAMGQKVLPDLPAAREHVLM